jgi:hypothetical protein
MEKKEYPGLRIFNIGDKVNTLISSYVKPDVLLPVKGTIMDVKWDPINPKYLIKIEKFYDMYGYVKRNYLNMYISNNVNDLGSINKMHSKESSIKSFKDIYDLINTDKEGKYYVMVYAVMTVKTYGDIVKLMDKLQFFFISEKLKLLREYMTRSIYKGQFKLDSGLDFDARLRKFFEGKFDSVEEMNFYIKSLWAY